MSDRPTCQKCGVKPCRPSYGQRGQWRTRCWKCDSPTRANNAKRRKTPIVDKMVPCKFCGFKPKHPIQMHRDHIDGDRTNNDLSNIQVLCANCHALKTIMAGDHLGRYREHEGGALVKEPTP